jgi:hypothetical protein
MVSARRCPQSDRSICNPASVDREAVAFPSVMGDLAERTKVPEGDHSVCNHKVVDQPAVAFRVVRGDLAGRTKVPESDHPVCNRKVIDHPAVAFRVIRTLSLERRRYPERDHLVATPRCPGTLGLHFGIRGDLAGRTEIPGKWTICFATPRGPAPLPVALRVGQGRLQSHVFRFHPGGAGVSAKTPALVPSEFPSRSRPVPMGFSLSR